MYPAAPAFSQEDSIPVQFAKKDTLVLDESALENTVYYSAKDSIYTDLRKRQIHLYNEATIDDGEVKMKAGYILIDLNKNEVYATHVYDADSAKTQRPVFTDGAEEIVASSIRYNFDTEKGYIEELAVKQDENFLYMEVAKLQSNDDIHFLRGRFTTCDLEEPHFHFQLSRAILIPEKRIVSGPMNLWVRGVPTPLGLPFIVIPQVDEDKTQGLIFPQIVPLSQLGFGIQDLGYYIPINDRFQTTFFASIYSRGSWGVRNSTDYAKRYKHRGRVDANFQQFNNGFPTNDRLNKLSLNWTHATDPKSSPYWQFNSSVNFLSDNSSKTNLDPQNEGYFNNSFNSDINLARNFPGKPLTAGMKVSLRQNSLSKNISLTAPVLTLNMTRVFPFKRFIKGQNALSCLGITYSFEGQNRSTFGDTSLAQGDFQRIGDQFQNGMLQKITVQTTMGLFKNRVKITPSVSYENRINFQQIRKEIDPSTQLVVVDTLSEFGMSNRLIFTAQATTAIYSYYRFLGKRQTIMRHVLTPTISFQYKPLLDRAFNDQSGTITYSPFERSLYSTTPDKSQALINFGINNTFELKQKSDKDTITGFKKTRLIDALTINSSYDLLKDSMNFSDFRANLRISPATWINLVVGSNFRPYGWNPETGQDTSAYALRSNGKLGRFTSTNFTTTLVLATRESREKMKDQLNYIEKNWNSDYEYFLLHPESAINFAIPWKVTLSHVYTINVNIDTASFSNQRWSQLQTLTTQGDVSITKRWKVTGTINMDLKTAMVTNARFGLTRDMHCWALAFNWTPIGGNKSFLFTLRATSSLFQDAKIQFKKPPEFL